MAITINGDGTLTGISVGGLPDGIVDTDMLATDAVSAAKIGSLPAGSILQVVTSVTTTPTSESISANSDGTTKVLSVSITPSSTSSKILVIYAVNVGGSYDYHSTILRRDTTKISIGTSTGNRAATSTYEAVPSTGAQTTAHTCMHLDSPSSTSALDYNVIIHNSNNGTNTYYTNRTNSDQDQATLRNRTASNIIVMEVAG